MPVARRKLKKSHRRGAAIGLAALALSGGLASSAQALSTQVSGTATSDHIRIGSNIRTKQGRGNVDIYYQNGIGWNGNNTLKMWLTRTDNSIFTNTRYLKGTGMFYNLGNDVLDGTRFKMAWQAASGCGLNCGWGGILYY